MWVPCNYRGMFSTQTLIAMAVFGVVWFFVIRWAIRRSRDIRDGKVEQPVMTIVYGAWQDHMLGTTKLEPGDITEIEKDLGKAAKHREE
jgi:hypothetical protein